MSIPDSPSRPTALRAVLGATIPIAATSQPLAAAVLAPSRKDSMSDTVSFVVYLPTKPEAREQMRKMLFEVLDNTAGEPVLKALRHVLANEPCVQESPKPDGEKSCTTCK
jgi:hypothetical protein